MNNKLKKILILFITLFFYNKCIGQKYTHKYIKDATIVANKWLSNMDNLRFDLTYNMMYDEIKVQYDSISWKGYFSDLMYEFGKKVKRRQIIAKKFKSTVEGYGDGFFVELNYEAFYEKTKNFKETILMKQDDIGNWKVLSYYPIWESL